jgi:hypothetical protein
MHACSATLLQALGSLTTQTKLAPVTYNSQMIGMQVCITQAGSSATKAWPSF